jgi:hypothetical protein
MEHYPPFPAKETLVNDERSLNIHYEDNRHLKEYRLDNADPIY